MNNQKDCIYAVLFVSSWKLYKYLFLLYLSRIANYGECILIWIIMRLSVNEILRHLMHDFLNNMHLIQMNIRYG